MLNVVASGPIVGRTAEERMELLEGLFEGIPLWRDICVVCSTVVGTMCIATAVMIARKAPFI